MDQSKQPNEFSNFSGFTLIEILLSMLLISILVLGINAVYSQAHKFWSRIKETQPIFAQSRTVFDTLRQELSFMYLPGSRNNEEDQESQVYFSVVSGTEISFITLNPAWNANPSISTPSKVTYTFTKDENTSTLMRTEQPYSGEKSIGAATENLIILHGLDNLQIQALQDIDEDAWKSDLKCTEKPPVAIKIQLSWSRKRGLDDMQLETIFSAQCSSILEDTNE